MEQKMYGVDMAAVKKLREFQKSLAQSAVQRGRRVKMDICEAAKVIVVVGAGPSRPRKANLALNAAIGQLIITFGPHDLLITSLARIQSLQQTGNDLTIHFKDRWYSKLILQFETKEKMEEFTKKLPAIPRPFTSSEAMDFRDSSQSPSQEEQVDEVEQSDQIPVLRNMTQNSENSQV